jgi:hypothetical protein
MQLTLNRIWLSKAEDSGQKAIKFPAAGHEGKPVSLATVSNRRSKSKWPLSKDYDYLQCCICKYVYIRALRA